MKNLDNLKELKKYDRKDMARFLTDFPDQCARAMKVVSRFSLPSSYRKIDKILVCGMGGSGIGGEILKSFLEKELKAPLIINKNYHIPAFVNARTLVFCLSYSGNTEETLSAFRAAAKKKAKIVAVTSGGKLEKLARNKKCCLVLVPGGFPPRASLGYLFFSLVAVLERLGLVKSKKDQYRRTLRLLKDLRGELSLSSKIRSNPAKRIALKLYRKLILIYTSPSLAAVGLRWRGQLAENSKVLASSNIFPELNHNEIVGWGISSGSGKKYHVIILRDRQDSSLIAGSIEIAAKIIKGKAGGIDCLYTRGEAFLCRLFSLVYLGDWVSYYLAILNGVDPTPVEAIDYLKKESAKGQKNLTQDKKGRR
jgi:glucose/mannose-6-phosphate isomerase